METKEPNEAGVVIAEAIISRNLEDRESLLRAFEKKIDSSLSSEIDSKLDGELKIFLLSFIKVINNFTLIGTKFYHITILILI